MEKKTFCQECGTPNEAGAKFCCSCGQELQVIIIPEPRITPVTSKTAEETNADTPASIVDNTIPPSMFEKNPQLDPDSNKSLEPKTAHIQRKEPNSHSNREPKTNNVVYSKPKKYIASKIFAALLGLLLLVSGLFPTVLFPLHATLEEDSIRDAIEAADVYEVVEDLLDGEDVGDFIVDSVHVKMQSKLSPSEKQIKKLLKDEDIKEFVADKIVDYATDILENNGDGEITSREIYRFVKDNRDAISDAIGYELKDSELDALKEQLDKSNMDDYSLDTVREKNEDIFNYISYAVSDITLYLSCAVVAIFVVLIFIICSKCIPVALKTVGIVFFINGGIAVLVNPAYMIVMKIMEDNLGRFTSLIDAVCKPFFNGILIVGLVFICAGAVMMIVNLIINLVRKHLNKSRAALKAR